MSRGTQDFTVQELMDFLYSQEQELREQMAEAFPRIGEAHIAGNKVWLDRERTDFYSRSDRASKLEEFRFEIERKCGELHDRKERETVAGKS